MDEDERADDEPVRSTEPTPAATTGEAVRGQRRRWPLILGIALGMPVLLIAAWTAISLNWSYSVGDRAGFIQKFSQKGWVCKTWEGDMSMVNIPGATPDRFLFTVRDDSVASEITKLMGSRVSLRYEEHRGIPSSCFGETGYFVTGVRTVP